MPPARIFLFISHFTRIYLLATLPGHPRAYPWASLGIQKHCFFNVFRCFFTKKITPATFSVLEDAPATYSVLEFRPRLVFFYLLATFFGVLRHPLTRASF